MTTLSELKEKTKRLDEKSQQLVELAYRLGFQAGVEHAEFHHLVEVGDEDHSSVACIECERYL